MNKKQQLEQEVFELVGQSNSSNSIATIAAMDAAAKMLDHQFGNGFSVKNPEMVLQLTETVMKNIRNSDLCRAIHESLDQLAKSSK